MSSSFAGTPSISMMDLRSQPGAILDRVFYRRESIVIERAGQPRAVLISLTEYEDIKRRKQEAKDRFWKMTEEIRAQLADKDPQEVEQVFAEALQAARTTNSTS